MTRSIGAGILRNTWGRAMDAPSSGITRLKFGLGLGRAVIDDPQRQGGPTRGLA
jgi:hypothetical protein